MGTPPLPSSPDSPPRRPVDYTLYLVTDPTLAPAASLSSIVAAAIAGGASVVQLRDKTASAADLAATARSLLAITRPAGVPLLINDRVDVAVAVGADGVHVGQDDTPAAAARAAMPRPCLVGVSAGTAAEAAAAAAAGADYVGVGAVYGTATKADAGEPLGVDGLEGVATAATAAGIPVVAIGGVGVANVEAVGRVKGVAGVAVVSAVVAAADPAAAAQSLRSGFERGRLAAALKE